MIVYNEDNCCIGCYITQKKNKELQFRCYGNGLTVDDLSVLFFMMRSELEQVKLRVERLEEKQNACVVR